MEEKTPYTTEKEKKDDPRKPVEVRIQGKVQALFMQGYWLSDGNRYLVGLPDSCWHMVGSEVEVVIRQLPKSPAAAH